MNIEVPINLLAPRSRTQNAWLATIGLLLIGCGEETSQDISPITQAYSAGLRVQCDFSIKQLEYVRYATGTFVLAEQEYHDQISVKKPANQHFLVIFKNNEGLGSGIYDNIIAHRNRHDISGWLSAGSVHCNNGEDFSGVLLLDSAGKASE